MTARTSAGGCRPGPSTSPAAAVGICAGLAAAMLLDPKRARSGGRRSPGSRTRSAAGRGSLAGADDRAKAVAAERGIGQPAKPAATDPVGVTTGRDMVPVMPVGDGPVTDPSSIVLEPLPGEAGGIEREPQTIAEPSTVDGTGDRAVTASHS